MGSANNCSTRRQASQRKPAFIFDLDGSLVDSVYQHVLAWRETLERCGIVLSVWRIDRRVGMSGGLLVNALLRETHRRVTREEVDKQQRRHAEAYAHHGQVRALPGASKLLAWLTANAVPWAIATSGMMESAYHALKLLEIRPDIPVIPPDLVDHAKLDPDLFFAAAEHLKVDIQDCIVVGDSIWDLLAVQQARALGIGLLSGWYGEEELEPAGAYRVYQGPLDLLQHLDEVGIRIGIG